MESAKDPVVSIPKVEQLGTCVWKILVKSKRSLRRGRLMPSVNVEQYRNPVLIPTYVHTATKFCPGSAILRSLAAEERSKVLASRTR
jgi:hypothetical protein